MTITPAASFVGYTNPNTQPLSPCANIGRWMHPTKTEIPAVFPSVLVTPIRPTLIDFPLSADRYGVAYTAGTIGVTDQIGRLAPGAGVYADDWVAYWTDAAKKSPSPHVLAIPGTLPAAYTARLKRDWHSAVNTASARINNSGSALTSLNVRNATGYTTITWVPDSRVWGFQISGAMTGGSVDPADPLPLARKTVWNTWDGPAVGYRKVQMQAVASDAGTPGWGSFRFTLSHNASGSALPIFADGDTIDGVLTVASGDMTTPSPTVGDSGAVTYGSAIMDCGPVLATNGNPTTFKVSWYKNDATPTFTTPLNMNLRIFVSPRVDIPLPFTMTGPGKLICVGGML